MGKVEMRPLCGLKFSALNWGSVVLLVAASLLPLAYRDSAAQAGSATKPDSVAADIASGIHLLQSREPAAAKQKFSAALTADPRSADALTWRGITENQLKQYEEAIRDFEAALAIDPNQLPAHYNLALSLIRVGQTDRAIEQLKIVVRVQPGVLEPEYNLAILLEEKHLTAEAVEHLKTINGAQQNDPGILQHLLVDLFVLGRTDEAQPILEQLRTASAAEAQMHAAKALLEAGQFRPAIQLLEDEHAQRGHESDMLLARAYIGAQENVQAIKLLNPTEKTDSTGETAYLLGVAHLAAGEMPEAKDAFEYAIKTNPRNARALYHLGMMQSDIPEQLFTALRDLREATRLEPSNPAYGIALGKILLQHNDAQEAMVLLQRVHAEGPESAERDLLLGIAQITVRGPGQAVPSLLRATSEDPSLALSYNMLGFCYFVQGDLAKAAAAYRQASDLNPETRIFAHGAAVALDRSNDAEDAMVYAARAVSLPGANGEDHYLVGKLLAKAGRNEDAVRELNEAIELSPDLDAAYYLLGRTYMQMGETAKATGWIRKLKDLKEKHERSYAEEMRNAKPIKSSTLLQGAPMAGSDLEAP
jgi:tetratricopeptide (TPR) repeat protein